MRVFLTGATGFIGSAIVRELLTRAMGPRPARSDAGAEALAAMGAERIAARSRTWISCATARAEADAVIHTAFNHDFSKFADNAEQDRRAIEALGDGAGRFDAAAAGHVRRLGSGPPAPPRPTVPATAGPRSRKRPRRRCGRGVRAATVRLAPSVHGLGDHGFVPQLVRLARETGVSAYLGDGSNRWSGVHRHDAARVYRLALGGGATEPIYHAVADEAVPFKAIAEVIGRRLGVPVVSKTPEEASEHFGWFARFAGMDVPSSSARTRSALGWRPEHAELIADIDQDHYFA